MVTLRTDVSGSPTPSIRSTAESSTSSPTGWTGARTGSTTGTTRDSCRPCLRSGRALLLTTPSWSWQLAAARSESRICLS